MEPTHEPPPAPVICLSVRESIAALSPEDLAWMIENGFITMPKEEQRATA